MVTLTLTDKQVEELVEQLPPERQKVIYERLAQKQWSRWDRATNGMEDEARRLAREQNLDWDALTEDERLAFVDSLIHETRGS